MEILRYGNSLWEVLVEKSCYSVFKIKERLLVILAKSLVFHCTLLVSNKNIFTCLVTLVAITSYSCVAILTS